METNQRQEFIIIDYIGGIPSIALKLDQDESGNTINETIIFKTEREAEIYCKETYKENEYQIVQVASSIGEIE